MASVRRAIERNIIERLSKSGSRRAGPHLPSSPITAAERALLKIPANTVAIWKLRKERGPEPAREPGLSCSERKRRRRALRALKGNVVTPHRIRPRTLRRAMQRAASKARRARARAQTEKRSAAREAR